MPIFAYECRKCGEEFELLVGVGADSKEPVCPECGGKKLQKLLSSFAVSTSSSSGQNGGPSCPNFDPSSCGGCSGHQGQ